MNIFGVGLPEMVLILVIALLIFGPKKLPEIGRSLGKALRGFQEASKEFESELKRQAELLETEQPMQATLETPLQTPRLTQAEGTSEPIATEATVKASTVDPAETSESTS